MPTRRTRYESIRSIPSMRELYPVSDGELVVYDKEGVGPQYVSYLCPCGCGDLLNITVAATTPGVRWDLERHDDGTLSLSPSVNQVGHECLSHYFIKRNQVQWC